MFEVLVLLTVTGLVLASDQRIGFGNPFQIYYLTWLPVLLVLYLFRETFVAVSSEYLLLMLTAKALVLLLTLVARIESSNRVSINEHVPLYFRPHLIFVAQVVVCLASPFAYFRAIELAGGEDIFTVIGYITLRSSMTEDGGQVGLLAYFSILSYVVTSLTVLAYRTNTIGLPRLVFSCSVSLFYIYLSTGRTNLLLLFSLTLMPLVMLGVVRLKGVLLSFFLAGVTFIFVAAMTAKGVSVEAGFLENIASLAENLRAYTVAPFLAMSQLIQADRSAEWGVNTFRFVFSVLYSLRLSDQLPPALIRDYAFVPDATNVYTVYDVYFRDFSYAGIFIPPLFLVLHWGLYRQAYQSGGKWLFYYAASVYPLVMQFFQDQYFSLLSIWIQVAFWFWIFVGSAKEIHNLRASHA